MAANQPGNAPASDKWVPYRKAQPRESPPELVIPDVIDDVFTRLDKCRAHYSKNGLGADFIDQFLR